MARAGATFNDELCLVCDGTIQDWLYEGNLSKFVPRKIFINILIANGHLPLLRSEKQQGSKGWLVLLVY
jgi:hypothetical protein